MSLPRLKGAISGPIRAYRLTVTAAHFSAYGGGEGENEKEAGGGGARCSVCATRLSAVDSTAGDRQPGMTSRPPRGWWTL